MADIDRYSLLAAQTKREYPRFHVKRRKDSWLHYVTAVLSFITRKDYKTFSTTIFSGMYTRDDWNERTPDQKYKLLRHEKKHIKQFHCWPLGRWAWPVNHIIMSFFYLLVLPVKFTFRAHFEREGYTQSMLTEFELNGPFTEKKAEYYARKMANTFGGSTYLFMWTKKKAYAWAVETIRKIHEREITNSSDRVDEVRAA